MKDRIKFSRGTGAASTDKKSFGDYAKGKISIETLCKRLAESNNLKVVTEKQALNEYAITGWKHIAETERRK